MTHTRPMSEHEGDFSGPTPSPAPCPCCGVSGQHYYRIWESSDGAYEDEKHECRACGQTWWIDGIDS